MLKSGIFAAAMLAGSIASAGTIIYDPNNPPPPSGNTVITTPLTAAGLDVAVTQTLLPGDSYEYVFTFSKALKISDIALSATGTASNIANVEFGLTPATTMVFTTIVPTGSQAFGGASLPGGTFAKGSTSAVPVPAALPLLAGALGALGLARRKFKKAA
jgi:hypothetical protein